MRAPCGRPGRTRRPHSRERDRPRLARDVCRSRDEAPADWAYSISLWHTLRSPEVCIFGLRVETMMSVRNVAGREIRNGHLLGSDQRRDDILNGYSVAVRPVHPSWYRSFFGAGIDFYQAPLFPIMHLFWPGKAGRFPWDDRAQEYCRASQPQLWSSKNETRVCNVERCGGVRQLRGW
ncbi:DUF4262 domain-containing protein [Streptomyces calvus]|uniref:DUF4262 domain-containing protein n=1 Tax=Streptomyces calvus TaxID=67282 RepID=UPI0037122594